MEWAVAHKTSLFGVLLGGVVLTGAALFADRFASTEVRSTAGWGSEGSSFQSLTLPVSSLGEHVPIPDVEEARLFSYLANNRPLSQPLVSPTASTPLVQPDGSLVYDDASIEALIASIENAGGTYASGPAIGAGNPEQLLQDVYDLIPTGFVSTHTQNAPSRTQEQSEMFEYGNAIGLIVESYYEAWTSRQDGILKRFIEDRSDAYKAGEVEELAEAMKKVGADIRDVVVPAPLRKQHEGLAGAYEAIGEKTHAVGKSRTDDELVAAMLSSNESSDAFARAYVAMADAFVMFGVTFSSSDAGKVFVFTPL